MKKKLFTIALLIIVGITSAQSKLGILTYNVPANWQIIQQTPNVVLEKTQIRKTANPCKIIVLPTENTVVNLEKTFISQVSSKTAFGEKYDFSTIKKTEANGAIFYGVKGTITINLKPVNCFFYSITSGEQTSFIRFVKGESDCLNDFQQFWSELLVDIHATSTIPGIKKKGSGASPAAPAPIM